jgi:hypothetical protein
MRQHLVIILFGLAAIGLGVYEYYDLAQMEMQGGTRRVHTVIKLLYETLGKAGVLGVFGITGLVMVGFGAFKIARRPRNEQAA